MSERGLRILNACLAARRLSKRDLRIVLSLTAELEALGRRRPPPRNLILLISTIAAIPHAVVRIPLRNSWIRNQGFYSTRTPHFFAQ